MGLTSGYQKKKKKWVLHLSAYKIVSECTFKNLKKFSLWQDSHSIRYLWHLELFTKCFQIVAFYPTTTADLPKYTALAILQFYTSLVYFPSYAICWMFVLILQICYGRSIFHQSWAKVLK